MSEFSNIANNLYITQLLQENDILSSVDKLPNIWDSYVKSSLHIDKPLNVILSSLKTNVIDRLSITNTDFENSSIRIKKFCDYIGKTQKNNLGVFLSALSVAIEPYCDKTQTGHIEINTESIGNISDHDKIKMISTMERFGILDSDQIQSLIDDRDSELATVCKNIKQDVQCWEPPSNKKQEETGNMVLPLRLKDFIPNLDEIETCVNQLLVEDQNAFPDSMSDMMKMISPSDNLDERRFYHPNCYLSNSANLKVITATIKYIGSTLELDTVTMVYALFFLNSKLKDILSIFGSIPCFVYAKLIVSAVLLKFLKAINTELIQGNNGILTEDYIRNVAKMSQLEDSLKSILELIDNDELTDFDKGDLMKDTIIKDYLDFIETSLPDSDDDFEESKKPQPSDDSFIIPIGELREDFQNILSELNDLHNEFGNTTKTMDKLIQSDIAATESLLEDIKVDIFSNGSGIKSRDYTSIIEVASTIHNELNQSLVNGDFENAASNLAKEIVIEMTITEALTHDKSITETLQPVKNRITQDVLTYRRLLESQVSGGIDKFRDSAKSFIEEKLKS